jgi:predicted enzyme related to lactoylglutathione lyase
MSTDKEPDLGNGKICYLAIPAIDINQSAAFYQTVFGWRIRTPKKTRHQEKPKSRL